MPFPFLRSAVPLAIIAFTVSRATGPLPTLETSTASRGVAYFEPPRSIGTPIDDLVRVYTGAGLAAKIEGRLRLDTDASLDAATRELIRRRLAEQS